MKIGGFQRCSLTEYPGKIGAIIFTQGCNYRCHYCHNPELVLPELFAPLIPQEEIFDFLRRRPLLQAVTITGGEPCLHSDLIDFVRQIKSFHLPVKINTNGSFPEIIFELLSQNLADYISLDVKAPFAKYQDVTGVASDTTAVKESIRLLQKGKCDYDFRTTVVSGLLNKEDFHAIGETVRGAKRYLLQRFVPTKLVNRQFLSRQSPSEEEMKEFQEIISLYVEKCEII